MHRTSSPTSLTDVRRQLEDLVGRRLLGPLSWSDQLRWADLTRLEMQLLGLGRPGAGAAPDEAVVASAP